MAGNVPVNLQSVVLKSQLIARARDFTGTMPKSIFVSKDGGQPIVDSVYKRDGLSVVNDIYMLFDELISAKRGDDESFDSYEGRFTVKMSKFNSYALFMRFCETLSVFLLLRNAYVENAQKISILAT